MTRAATVFVLLGALAAPAGAQYIAINHLPFYDSASVILTGDTGSVQLEVYTGCGGLSQYTVRLYFDSSRLTFLGADSVPGYGMPKPTATTGTDYVELSATGSTTLCYVRIADVHFQLSAGAVEGSFLSISVTALVNNAAISLLASTLTYVGQVCQALSVWGDADGSRTVTSRDALVLLTAAVGLPTTGFDLTHGDVDGDAEVTTRDALYVLSAAIGYYNGVTGRPKANRCAPLAPAPSDAAFLYNANLWRIAAGDTVPLQVRSTPYANNRPSWKPDGTRILVDDWTPGFSQEILSVSLDGSVVDTLTKATGDDYAASWSPADTLIAFVSARIGWASVWVMAPNGTGQVRLTLGDTLWVYETAWAPDGNEILFTAYSSGACCNRRLWGIKPDGTALRLLNGSTVLGGVEHPAVSPAGDSVIVRGSSSGNAWLLPIAGDTAVLATRLSGQERYTNWVSAGTVFRAEVLYPYGFYLRRPDGRILRFARGIGSSYNWLGMRSP